MEVIGEIKLSDLGIQVKADEENKPVKVLREVVTYGSGEDFYVAIHLRVASQQRLRAKLLLARAWDIIRKRPTATPAMPSPVARLEPEPVHVTPEQLLPFEEKSA